MRAFETANVALLTDLLAQDAILTMPPLGLWFRGRDAVTGYIGDVAFAHLGALHLVELAANGQPAFAAYEQQSDGTFAALGLMVLTVEEGQVSEINAWPDPSLFPSFGLPARLVRP